VRRWLGSAAVFLALVAPEDSGKQVPLREWFISCEPVGAVPGGLCKRGPPYVYVECIGRMDGLELISRATFY
jgi:hypothetical protein